MGFAPSGDRSGNARFRRKSAATLSTVEGGIYLLVGSVRVHSPRPEDRAALEEERLSSLMSAGKLDDLALDHPGWTGWFGGE